jgi:hypothetical protein
VTDNEILLPTSAAADVAAEVKSFGALGVETGGFLMARRAEVETTVVALAGSAGIVRRRDLFQISEKALDRLFAYADRHELWIPAQFHSHARMAFMSDCDVDHGLSVEGFITTIIPYFATPPVDPSQWGWWHFDRVWRAIGPPETSSAAVKVIRFDENGAG